MKILVGADDAGCLKEICCSKGSFTSDKNAKQPESILKLHEQGRANRVLQILALDGKVAVSRNNSVIELVSSESHEVLHTWTIAAQECAFHLASYKSWLLSCTEQGTVYAFDLTALERQPVRFQCGGPVTAFCTKPEEHCVVVLGGQERDAEIFQLDLETGSSKSLWKATNVDDDELDLRVPIWVTGVFFSSKSQLAVTTGYGKLRLYDIELGKIQNGQPVAEYELSKKGITNVDFKDGTVVFVDSNNSCGTFNMVARKQGGKLKGNLGAVKCLKFTPDNLVAMAGLDRNLRIFDASTRKQVVCIFLNSYISALEILETEETMKRKADAVDDEKLWKEIDKLAKTSSDMKKSKLKN